MRWYRNNAFSLIELMVVVAIVGILSGMAVPLYRDYTTRSKLLEVINITQFHLDKVKEEYEVTGAMPASVYGINANSNGLFPSSDYIATMLYNDGSNPSQYGMPGAHMLVVVGGDACTGLNKPGLVCSSIPGNTGGGTHHWIIMSFVDDGSGILRTYCGIWGLENATESVDLSFLPSSCRDINISASVGP